MATFTESGLRVDANKPIKVSVTEVGPGSPAFGDYVVYTVPAGKISRISFTGANADVATASLIIKKRISANSSSPTGDYQVTMASLDFSTKLNFDQTELEEFWLNQGESIILNISGFGGGSSTLNANLSAMEYVPNEITDVETFDS